MQGKEEKTKETVCRICGRFAPCILATWDEPYNLCYTCIDCLDQQEHENELFELSEFIKEHAKTAN